MKIVKVLYLIIMLLSFPILTACSIDETTFDVAIPTATPNPLLSMDEVDRALFLYERMSNIDISSYQKHGILVRDIAASNERIYDGIQFDVTSINLKQNDFVEHKIVTYYADNIVIKEQECGFINGYTFNKIVTGSEEIAFKKPISIEQYISETQYEKLYEALTPSKETCSKIFSRQNDDGTWTIQFFWSSLENCQVVLSELMEKNISYDKEMLESLELEYLVRVSEQGYPLLEYVYVCSNPDKNNEVLIMVNLTIYYDKISEEIEYPSINLDEYNDLLDIEKQHNYNAKESSL